MNACKGTEKGSRHTTLCVRVRERESVCVVWLLNLHCLLLDQAVCACVGVGVYVCVFVCVF